MSKLNIYSFLSKGDPQSLIAIFKVLQERPSMLKTIQHEAGLFLKAIETKPFSIINTQQGLSFYIANMLYYVDESASYDFNATIDLLSTHKDSDTPLISPEQIKNMIKLVEQFGAKKIIQYNANDMPLVIALVPYQTVNNSTFSPPLHIIQCNNLMDDTNHSLEHIFIHEMGHALHSCLTGNTNTTPKSFKKAFEVANSCSIEDVKDGVLREFFADFFSLAVMYDTEYHSLHPLYDECHMSRQYQLHLYFKMLCEAPAEADSENFWTQGRMDYINDTVQEVFS